MDGWMDGAEAWEASRSPALIVLLRSICAKMLLWSCVLEMLGFDGRGGLPDKALADWWNGCRIHYNAECLYHLLLVLQILLRHQRVVPLHAWVASDRILSAFYIKACHQVSRGSAAKAKGILLLIKYLHCPPCLVRGIPGCHRPGISWKMQLVSRSVIAQLI